MTTNKLAKLMNKLNAKMIRAGLCDGAEIIVEHEGLVKITEHCGAFTTSSMAQLVEDEVIMYPDPCRSNSDGQRAAIKTKDLKKLVKIICRVRTF